MFQFFVISLIYLFCKLVIDKLSFKIFKKFIQIKKARLKNQNTKTLVVKVYYLLAHKLETNEYIFTLVELKMNYFSTY